MAIESDFRSSKMRSKVIFVHPKWPKRDFQNGGHFEKKIQKKKELGIDLKWREMRSKVIFGHPKWPKRDFQNGPKGTSKMAAGGHFEKNFKKIKVAY